MEDQSILIKVANRNKENLYTNILKSSHAKGNLKLEINKIVFRCWEEVNSIFPTHIPIPQKI